MLAAFTDLAPAAATLLATIRDQHAQHRDALGGTASEPARVPAPASPAAAIASLVAAERTASRDRIRSCVAADSPESARLLAFIAASEASHVPALRDLTA